jgi:hypothetical protein
MSSAASAASVTPAPITVQVPVKVPASAFGRILQLDPDASRRYWYDEIKPDSIVKYVPCYGCRQKPALDCGHGCRQKVTAVASNVKYVPCYGCRQKPALDCGHGCRQKVTAAASK